VQAITEEFERAANKASNEPREAVSAAANILEAICKHYITEEGLQMPAKQVLGDLWGVVRKDLGFDPGQVADDDLRGILAGLIQVVQGLAAFRTHASSARRRAEVLQVAAAALPACGPRRAHGRPLSAGELGP
jgi:hypothetical protein